jgi:hypothetical protein
MIDNIVMGILIVGPPLILLLLMLLMYVAGK